MDGEQVISLPGYVSLYTLPHSNFTFDMSSQFAFRNVVKGNIKRLCENKIYYYYFFFACITHYSFIKENYIDLKRYILGKFLCAAALLVIFQVLTLCFRIFPGFEVALSVNSHFIFPHFIQV